MDQEELYYRRFLAGDDEALTALVKACRPGLCAYLFTIVRDRDLAEDLTEDTFVKLLLKRPRSTGKASFKTWLYTIGRNLACDRLRKDARRGETFAALPEDLPDRRFDPAAALSEKADRQALYAALLRLHPPYRQVLWLIYFEDFSVKECARILKKSPNAVSVLHRRAKEALKKELEKEL